MLMIVALNGTRPLVVQNKVGYMGQEGALAFKSILRSIASSIRLIPSSTQQTVDDHDNE